MRRDNETSESAGLRGVKRALLLFRTARVVGCSERETSTTVRVSFDFELLLNSNSKQETSVHMQGIIDAYSPTRSSAPRHSHDEYLLSKSRILEQQAFKPYPRSWQRPSSTRKLRVLNMWQRPVESNCTARGHFPIFSRLGRSVGVGAPAS